MFIFLCSADHEQDWQPYYQVDLYTAIYIYIICHDHKYYQHIIIIITVSALLLPIL